jgi:hypothetical protein
MGDDPTKARSSRRTPASVGERGIAKAVRHMEKLQVRRLPVIRLTNEDVTDLYSRVKVGTRVVVLPGGPPAPTAATDGLIQGTSRTVHRDEMNPVGQSNGQVMSTPVNSSVA